MNLSSNQKSQEAVAWMDQHSDVFGPSQTRQEVLAAISQNPDVQEAYSRLSEELKEEFLCFCMGVQGMKITYDPIFKAVFDPEEKPKRLEEFLSLCLGEHVKILQVLPNESKRLTEEGSLLVMDILIRLESGALVNVEIQRVGYLFPGARCACYSSDLVMRQYSQVRALRREEGKKFSYHDIKRVYTIVLIQKSTEEFHQFPEEYLHYAKQTFNTGLKLDLLQEYLLIPLDIFLENHQNISKKLDAWLYFIASDRPEDIQNVLEAYPEFRELYREVFAFRSKKEELVSMYSEALRILDANTTQYMIEIQQEEINRLKKEKEETKLDLEENQKELKKSHKELEKSHKELEKSHKELEKSHKELEKSRKQHEEEQKKLEDEILRLKALLEQQGK